MKAIHILSVGKPPAGWRREAFEHYIKPTSAWVKVEAIHVREQRIQDDHGIAAALEKEAADIVRALPDRTYFVLLDLKGKRMTSESFSEWLSDALQDNHSVTFAIGGPNGVAPSLRQKADAILSLSDFTFPHDLARIVIAEQIFRALSIRHGHPYHR